MKVMSTQPEISDSGADAGALVFQRGEKNANLAEIYSSLLRQDGVATGVPLLGGCWNILLRLEAKDQESLERLIEKDIRTMNGVEDIEANYGEESWTVSGDTAEYKASACAVLDVDPGSFTVPDTPLLAMDGVTEGYVTDGGKKTILFLHGNSSREIRNVLGEEIRRMPGVLRVKLYDAMFF
jgi:DNA-binding Lrp family transcriptional regulator